MAKNEKDEPHQKLGWYQVLRKGKQNLLHMWHQSSCSCYNKPGK